jgi:hypothetical protein
VVPRPSLPRSLRRAASRPAVPGRQPPSKLVAAVAVGDITRANTKPGTVGRRAVYQAEAARRIAGRRPGESVSEALGHEKEEVRSGRAVSAYLADRPGLTLIESPTKGEASRLARYSNLVGQLASGKIKPEAFHRRVSRWQPVQGQALESDPARVFSTLEALQAADQVTFVYASGRAA